MTKEEFTEHACELDDDHPLWLVNAQIVGLLEGEGADEDHEDVLAFLRATGLPEGTIRRMHRAIVHGDSKEQVKMSTLTPLESRLRCILQEKYGVNTAEEALRLALEAEQHVQDCGPGDPATLYFANSQRDLETLAFLIEKEQSE